VYSSTMFYTSALEQGEGSASRPSRFLYPGKTRYPLYMRLGGPQGRPGNVRKITHFQWHNVRIDQIQLARRLAGKDVEAIKHHFMEDLCRKDQSIGVSIVGDRFTATGDFLTVSTPSYSITELGLFERHSHSE
jgi:hypothetical protein